MIGPHNAGINRTFLDALFERLRYEEVIDPPADIALARVRKMTPPGVVAGTLSEQAKCVNETRRKDLHDPGAFFVRIARLALVGFGMVRSSGVCATLRSPQKMTGFFFSSERTYARNAGSQCSCRTDNRLRSGLAFGV